MRNTDHKELEEALKERDRTLQKLQQETHHQWDVQILALSSVAIWFTADYAATLSIDSLMPQLALWAIGLFVLSIVVTLIGFSVSADHLEQLLKRNGDEFAFLRDVRNLKSTGRADDELKAASLGLAFERTDNKSRRAASRMADLIRYLNKVRMHAFIAGALSALTLLLLNSISRF